MVVFLELMSGQGATSKGSTGLTFLFLFPPVFLEGLESSGIHSIHVKRKRGNINIQSSIVSNTFKLQLKAHFDVLDILHFVC